MTRGQEHLLAPVDSNDADSHRRVADFRTQYRPRMTYDRLNGISAFVEVVDAGSFSVAAVRLSVTRSAITKTIARLEQRLGVRLFHRTTRRQSLTDDGQAYYEHCVRALRELNAAEEAFDSGRKEPAPLSPVFTTVISAAWISLAKNAATRNKACEIRHEGKIATEFIVQLVVVHRI